MDLDVLEEILRDIAGDVGGSDGAWQFELDGVQMACLTDLEFDRLRVIAPVIDCEAMTAEQTAAVLEANFHSALDARYGTSDGVLYAAFLHPLESLTEDELRSAIEQVLGLVETFGSTYTGGTLVFGVPPGGSPGGAPN